MANILLLLLHFCIWFLNESESKFVLTVLVLNYLCHTNTFLSTLVLFTQSYSNSHIDSPSPHITYSESHESKACNRIFPSFLFSFRHICLLNVFIALPSTLWSALPLVCWWQTAAAVPSEIVTLFRIISSFVHCEVADWINFASHSDIEMHLLLECWHRCEDLLAIISKVVLPSLEIGPYSCSLQGIILCEWISLNFSFIELVIEMPH